MSTYRSPLLGRPGAVAATGPDAGVAAHYGDPMREQRAPGPVDLSHRGVVRVSGPDRLGWLHSLTTQHVEQLPAGQATTALLLSPHGHVEHALYGVDDGTAFWAHVEPGTGPALVAFLDSMRFLLRVEVADLSDELAVVWEPESAPRAGHLSRVTDRGREVFVPRASLASYVGDAPSGVWAHEARRIAAHEPRLGLDTDHKTIPHEVGWIGSAVHLDKGCYRGQETVARVHTLGRPPRRLVMLHLDGSVDHLPAHCDDVDLDGRTVGFVGSAARHHELGPIALVLVRRNVPVDVELLAGGVAAAQEVVVDPEVGLHVRARPS
ncbi:MAG TPA: folate-binding protein [Jiangellaceae bacterium]|nr:folate-binding protein [Jiangellaceae bacterium]